MRPPSNFVYVLRSVPAPTRYYVGLTSDVRRRLETHYSGGSQHTAAIRPWALVASIEFASEASAAAFEKYGDCQPTAVPVPASHQQRQDGV